MFQTFNSLHDHVIDDADGHKCKTDSEHERQENTITTLISESQSGTQREGIQTSFETISIVTSGRPDDCLIHELTELAR